MPKEKGKAKRQCENCGHLTGLLMPKPECERSDDQDCILNGRPNWIPMSASQLEILKLKEKKARHNERCPKCGRLIRDPENITNAEKFKSTFSPRIHAHGASNHGNEPELREIALRSQGRGEVPD